MLKKLFSRSTAPEVTDPISSQSNGSRRRVMVIGLDCAAPELIFDRWLDDLPNLKSLYQHGLGGALRSCDPPITVPAWSVMMSSKSPGRLGVYGFRNRADHSYDRYSIANSLAIKEDRLWEILSREGKRSIVIGVPGTYPPKPLNGTMVTDFLTRILIKAPLYILLGAFSVLHLKGLLTGLSGVVSGAIPGNAVTTAIKPALRGLWSVLKEAFGSKPESMTFQLTHILLVACLFALLAIATGVSNLKESTDRQTTAIQQLIAVQTANSPGGVAKSTESKKHD